MINIIWLVILSFGIIFGIVTGKGSTVSLGILDSAGSAVKLVVGLLGVMCLWCGIMKIAQKSGLTEKIARMLKPVLKHIFKEGSKDEKAMGDIVMNLTANMMGLSNAATPFGIKAMEDLQRRNRNKDVASNDMALFLVLNATCIQLIPTTVISIRAACGSKNPGEIILPAIIATGTAAVTGIILCKILEKYF